MTDSKKNPELGALVHAHLVSQGVETPIRSGLNLSGVDKKRRIEAAFKDIMLTMGLDLADDSLVDTPRRVAKMYVDELFSGLDYANFPKCTTVDNKMHYDEMVITKASVMSNCEHHFVIISGRATLGYIPKDKVLGLSKLNRIVEFFAKRPQIQERLTEQIYHTLAFILDTPDVAVVISAEHYCVKARGVKDVTSSTITSKLGGAFMDTSMRAEFLSLVMD